jgi:hypothetical protein
VLAAARVLGHLLALGAGVAAGVLGSFTFAYTRWSLPVGLLVALSLCLAVFLWAGLLLRSRGAAGVATAGWLVTVGLMSMQRPEGDLIVPATALGYCWLLVGIMVAGCSLAVPYAAITAGSAGGARRTEPAADALPAESSGTAPAGR